MNTIKTKNNQAPSEAPERSHSACDALLAPIERFQAWQKENPEWHLICDIENTDSLYVQWNELPKKERMSWIGKFGSEAREAFEEFGIKKCKVTRRFLNSECQLVDEWPQGDAMTVYLLG